MSLCFLDESQTNHWQTDGDAAGGGGAATPRGPKFLGAGLQPGLEILDL